MKSNLRQFGAWDSELEAKAKEVLALRYAEADDSPETFDFKLCQRADSSIYGIADGLQCQKGREVSRSAVISDLQRRGVDQKKIAKLNSSLVSDKAFATEGRKLLRESGAIKPRTPAIQPAKAVPQEKVAPAAKKPAAKKAEDMTDAEKEKRLKELRAERDKRQKEKSGEKPTTKKEEKPIEQQKTEARKENMKAKDTEPKKRISTVPGGQKTKEQLLIEELYPGIDGSPKVGDMALKIKAYKELEKRFGPDQAEESMRVASALLAVPTATQRSLSSTLRVEEIKNMQVPDISRKLLDGYEDPSKLIGAKFEYDPQTKKIVTIPTDGSGQIIPMNWKISDEAAWAYYLLAPKSFRDTISKAGKPGGNNAFQGYDENGNMVHGKNAANDARRLHLVKLWLAQGGRNAYDGLPLTFANADLEHIVPIKKIGEKAESPNNWVWVSNSANQTKGALTMREFLEGPRGKEKQKDAFNGVNNITDFERWEKYAARQAQAAVANKEKGASIKAEAGEILRKLQADNDMRESTIALYRGGKGEKSKLDKVLKYMSDLEGNGAPSFRREVTFRNADGEWERNNAKDLMLIRADFKTGQISGKMSMAEWTVREWPSLTGSQRVKAMNLWEEIVQDWAQNVAPTGAKKSWISQEFAKRAEEIYQ